MKYKIVEIMKKNKKMKLNNKHSNHSSNNKNLNNKNKNLEAFLQKMLKNYKMIYNKLKHKYKT